MMKGLFVFCAVILVGGSSGAPQNVRKSAEQPYNSGNRDGNQRSQGVGAFAYQDTNGNRYGGTYDLNDGQVVHRQGDELPSFFNDNAPFFIDNEVLNDFFPEYFRNFENVIRDDLRYQGFDGRLPLLQLSPRLLPPLQPLPSLQPWQLFSSLQSLPPISQLLQQIPTLLSPLQSIQPFPLFLPTLQPVVLPIHSLMFITPYVSWSSLIVKPLVNQPDDWFSNELKFAMNPFPSIGRRQFDLDEHQLEEDPTLSLRTLPRLKPLIPFSAFNFNPENQQIALNAARKAFDLTSNQAGFIPDFPSRFSPFPGFQRFPEFPMFGNRFSEAANSAVAFGAIGPGYTHQMAAINPENPMMPNINVSGKPNSMPGMKSVSTSSFSSSMNVNGEAVNHREAETTINDNGQITKYTVSN